MKENSKIKEQREKLQFKIKNCLKSKKEIKNNEEIWSVHLWFDHSTVRPCSPP